jgi:uncharacterized protein YegP (UPF0339 family)
MVEAKKPVKKKPEQYPVQIVSEVHVYRDKLGEWRWRALAGNRKIIATSGEGYNNRMYCHKVARSIYPNVSVWFV